jgi:hypothetical protein
MRARSRVLRCNGSPLRRVSPLDVHLIFVGITAMRGLGIGRATRLLAKLTLSRSPAREGLSESCSEAVGRQVAQSARAMRSV